MQITGGKVAFRGYWMCIITLPLILNLIYIQNNWLHLWKMGVLRKLIGNMVQKIFFRKNFFFSARNIFLRKKYIFLRKKYIFSARNKFFSARNIFFPQEIFFSTRNIFVVIGQTGCTITCSVRRKRPKQVLSSRRWPNIEPTNFAVWECILRRGRN